MGRLLTPTGFRSAEGILRCVFVAWICLVLLLLCTPTTFALPSSAEQNRHDGFLTVRTAILFLDWETYALEGVYRHEEPLNKILLPEHFTPLGDLCYQWVSGGDQDTFHLRNLLTAQREVTAIYSYFGPGYFTFPPDSLITHQWQHGFESDDPDTMVFYYIDEPQGRLIWSLVEDTDHVNWVAETGRYEVAIVGLAGFGGCWGVVVFSRPEGPPDLACVRIVWPRTLLTRGLPVCAEARIHNFGGRPLLPSLRLIASLPSAFTRVPMQELLLPDSSRLVQFEPLVPWSGQDVSFLCKVAISGPAPPLDFRPANDTLSVEIRLVDDPVFRSVSSNRFPGEIPLNGEPCDFDGDLDIDVVQRGYNPRLWQNDGTGAYTDITAQTPVVLPHHPRLVICKDFGNDGLPDLLLCYFSENPVLLVGIGGGRFIDGTGEAGLLGLGGYPGGVAIDLERDGDEDLIFVKDGRQVVLENDGTGRFTDVTSGSGLDHPEYAYLPAAGDLNGDAYADIVLPNWDIGSHVFINRGDGTFDQMPGPWDYLPRARTAVVFDFDRDSRNDILITQGMAHSDSTHLYRNYGTYFLPYGPAMEASMGSAAGDFDQDGWTDILLDHLDHPQLLKNEHRIFEDRTELLVEAERYAYGSSTQPKWLDLDLDEDLDLYTAIQVFLNQGVPPHILADSDGLADHPATSRADALVLPNPYTPGNSIRLVMSRSSPTCLLIYDVQGRAVGRLVDAWLKAGEYQIPWDGADFDGRRVPAGIYYYSLTTAGASVRGSLMLVR